MLKIWGLKIKELKCCWLLNFENDLIPVVLKPGPNALAHTLGGMTKGADFFLKTPTLTASNFATL